MPLHRLGLTVAAFVLGALTGGLAWADTPPEPRGGVHRTCSLNGRWCLEALASPLGGATPAAWRVFRQPATAHPTSAWRLAATFTGAPAVTNDGSCVIDQATGSNLLPEGARASDPAFVLHCRGRAPVVLPLDKFIANLATLPASTSHNIWASSFGLDGADRLVVNTADGRSFLIDARSGKLLQGRFLR